MFSFSRFQLSAQRGAARLFIMVFSIVATVSVGGQAGAQSLSGLRIGDSIEKTELLGLKPKVFERSGPVSFFKWEFVDGNTLSLTALESGTIVYIESNWGRRQAGAFSDLKGAKFGETTLNELRRAFGNNGFCYVERGCTISIQDGIALFNSYEIEKNPDVIVTFVTLVTGSPTNEEVGDQAKLDGIIIGYRKYLDGIWGERKVFDKVYKPILWP